MTSYPTTYPAPKLILDKTLSATLLVVLSPVFGFLVVAMGADMVVRSRDRGGPWLYRERRISRGREFDLLKFRTLRARCRRLDRPGPVSRVHARVG